MQHRLNRVFRTRAARVGATMAAALAAVAAGGSVVQAVSNQPHELPAATEGQEQQYLREHSDRFGRVRADLWSTGVRQFRALPVSAAWHKGKVSAKALANPSAPSGPVIGSQWKQVGPQPLIIDNEQNFQGSGPDSGEIVIGFFFAGLDNLKARDESATGVMADYVGMFSLNFAQAGFEDFSEPGSVAG